MMAVGTTDFWVWQGWDVVVSVGLFLSTGFIVVCIFGQRGEIRMSPQRAAAIATGHTDRRTIFENPVFRPMMWIFLAISHRLRFAKLKDYIRRQLVASGNPNYFTPEEYLAICLISGIGLGVVLEFLNLMLSGQPSVMAVLLGVVIGAALAIMQLAGQADKRLRQITRQLPYVLDLISLAMGAGANFTDAVRTIIEEDRGDDDPLNVELRTLMAEIEFGTTRREALINMAKRVPLESMQSLSSAVMQAEKLGTPLATVLHDQSTSLRLQRSVRAENMAATASVRILVPCLLLVMAVILTIFGPAIIRTMRGGLF